MTRLLRSFAPGVRLCTKLAAPLPSMRPLRRTRTSSLCSSVLRQRLRSRMEEARLAKCSPQFALWANRSALPLPPPIYRYLWVSRHHPDTHLFFYKSLRVLSDALVAVVCPGRAALH